MSSPVLGASGSGSPGPASSRRCPGDLTAARSSGTHDSLCQRRCERDTWLWRQAAHVPLRPAGSVQPRARLARPPGCAAAAGAFLPVAGTSFNRLLNRLRAAPAAPPATPRTHATQAHQRLTRTCIAGLLGASLHGAAPRPLAIRPGPCRLLPPPGRGPSPAPGRMHIHPGRLTGSLRPPAGCDRKHRRGLWDETRRLA